MKPITYILLFVAGIFVFSSCDKYLDKTPEADVTDADVFGNYEAFQGFVDPMYSYVIDYNNENLISSMNIGGDINSLSGVATGHSGNLGLYWGIINVGASVNQGLYWFSAGPGFGSGPGGIWAGSWRGIRVANLALKKLSLLTDATDEEKAFIEGQAYFFRAWFHWEIIRSFGGMPYIDTVLAADDEFRLPRLSYQETTEKICEDFDKAAALLPVDWDKTVIGGTHVGANAGRATKGAALAFKAKALLYAGSPLMNGFSGNNFEYNKSYMERAAAAAWEVINIANSGVYSLVPFSNYRDMFAKNDGTMPWTTESIFQKMKKQVGSGQMLTGHGRVFSPSRFGGNTNNECVNQLFVDRFEMADGTRYNVSFDNDNIKRWNSRDPRFRQNIIVDRDKWGFNANTVFKMYTGGTDNGSSVGFSSPYIVKKFWPIGVNSYDTQWASYRWGTPHMRLADVYLIYAEAVNEAYGPSGIAPGATITAVDALNKIRTRAGMPNITAAATGYPSFRELVWNERCVELCFEGNYWFDIRRWYVAHLPEYKQFVDLQFNQTWTSFNRSLYLTRVFDNPKHYWMPIYKNQVQIYKGFYQNPGW
jgi:starch-binding outer membrane protein, SusD/RagB family